MSARCSIMKCNNCILPMHFQYPLSPNQEGIVIYLPSWTIILSFRTSQSLSVLLTFPLPLCQPWGHKLHFSLLASTGSLTFCWISCLAVSAGLPVTMHRHLSHSLLGQHPTHFFPLNRELVTVFVSVYYVGMIAAQKITSFILSQNIKVSKDSISS